MDKKLSWKDVFNAYNIHARPDIYSTNAFIFRHTSYKYFLFNDGIHKVLNPDEFTIRASKTGIKEEEVG